jgi:DNA-binding MarR family transcriptional regulator
MNVHVSGWDYFAEPLNLASLAFLADLSETSRMIHQAFETLMGDEEIVVTFAEFRILAFVSNAGAAKQGDLIKQFRTGKGAISAMAGKLESRGLIVQRRANGDRRARLLMVTPIGSDLLARATEALSRAKVCRDAIVEPQLKSSLVKLRDRLLALA